MYEYFSSYLVQPILNYFTDSVQLVQLLSAWQSPLTYSENFITMADDEGMTVWCQIKNYMHDLLHEVTFEVSS